MSFQTSADAHLASSPSTTERATRPVKLVLVHGGARDGYQVALALAERGLLQALVTDLLWSSARPWMRWVERLVPRQLRSMLRRREMPALSPSLVRNHYVSAVKAILLDKVPQLPFRVRQRAIRSSDAALGRAAGRLANRTGAGLLTYSYYAADAFQHFRRPGILFQVHPHPVSVRRLLMAELEAHPECAASLRQEWELALPAADFDRLAAEPALAQRFLCASTFTRDTLVEHGADPAAIRVVPYGVDLRRFHPAAERSAPDGGPLRLLFVGRINQRKGVKYLVEALEQLRSANIHLTVCGRVVDDLQLFRSLGDRVQIRPSVGYQELLAAFQTADLFVLPSVAEGFGQVLLEALACGLPVLSTTHTAAPDLIVEGEAGFVVPPRRADLLADRIERAASDRARLYAMRRAARSTAEAFTWERFRAGIGTAVHDFSAELYPDNPKP